MPKGKKGGGGKGGRGQDKAKQQQKEKVVKDKTFGLKNKNKSKKVQTYVKQQMQQAKQTGRREMPPQKTRKQIQEEKKAEYNAIFKPVIGTGGPGGPQKLAPGVDPKSVVCAFFKRGTCRKGNKCKFSHDLSLERKSEKASIFEERRKTKEEDLMEDWTDEKLAKVVNQKQTNVNRNLPTTIICKYFLEAVESRKYGWFWECKNGDNCLYRHALPPGYQLKRDQKKEEEKEKPLLEELLEEERRNLETATPLTLELFLKWKEQKYAEKQKEEEAKKAKRKEELKSGKVKMSGREMFSVNPTLFVDDDSAMDNVELEEKKDLDENVPFANVIEVTGTSITRTALKPTPKPQEEAKQTEGSNAPNVDVVQDASLFVDDAEDDDLEFSDDE